MVVVGLGLLGLLTVQMVRAAGCRVVGVEPVERRRALAAELGAELVVAPDEAEAAVEGWSDRLGADTVIVTATASGDEIANAAVRMVRRKGRVVPVGDVGLGFDREALYEREADVLISTSYGPGRYDSTYEEAGIDYPASYVRWTAGRNMEEFLRLLATGDVALEKLVELELPVDRAGEAYAALAGADPPLAAVLSTRSARPIPLPSRDRPPLRRQPRTAKCASRWSARGTSSAPCTRPTCAGPKVHA